MARHEIMASRDVTAASTSAAMKNHQQRSIWRSVTPPYNMATATTT